MNLRVVVDVTINTSNDMRNEWQIDEYGPYDDAFEEALLSDRAPNVVETIMQMLFAIEREPQRGVAACVGGQTVRIVRTTESTSAAGTTPPLMLAYVVEPHERVIQPLFVCRAPKNGQSLEMAIETIRPELERIIHSAEPRKPRPEPRPYYVPVEGTTIDVKKLDEAIERVIARRAQRA